MLFAWSCLMEKLWNVSYFSLAKCYKLNKQFEGVIECLMIIKILPFEMETRGAEKGHLIRPGNISTNAMKHFSISSRFNALLTNLRAQTNVNELSFNEWKWTQRFLTITITNLIAGKPDSIVLITDNKAQQFAYLIVFQLFTWIKVCLNIPELNPC